MKNFLFSVGLLLLGAWGPQQAHAQAPAWQSAQTVAAATVAAASDYSEVTATAVDAAGNVYLAGNFRNNVMLGSTLLSSVGSDDVFVAKFNPTSNQFVWAQRAGSANLDKATALAVSGTSVYVAGNFTGSTALFGAITLTNASSNGGSDAFVAKLTDAGSTSSFAWAQRAGGTTEDRATALVVSSNNVYVAGSFNSAPASFGAVTLTTSGFNDMFVAKLTDAGSTSSFEWAQRAGGTSEDYATALAVGSTSVYVAGYFGSVTASFGTTSLSNLGGNDVFVAKISDAGSTSSFNWAQQAGGAGSEIPAALAVRGTNVYVAGSFNSTAAGFGTTTLTSASVGFNDVFVAKLSDAGSTGSFAWAQRAGGAGQDYATALAVSGTSVFVAGYYGGTTAGFGTTSLSNAGGNDVFVAKLSDAGSTSSFAWAQQAGGTGQDEATALAVRGPNVYVAGFFSSSTASFGTTTLANPTPTTSIGFVAALADLTLTATTAAVGPRASVTLFPNPARHTVSLRLPVGAASAPLALTDAQGRAVRNYPAPASPRATLDLEGMPAGLYLLRGIGPAQRLVVE